MIEVRVLEGGSHLFVGKYKFLTLPRTGDKIAVQWSDEHNQVRRFEVKEVQHFSSGVKMEGVDETPSVELLTIEIT